MESLFPSLTANSTDRLRLQRATLLARHDSGAVSPATYNVIRQLEIEISWREHAGCTDFAHEREYPR